MAGLTMGFQLHRPKGYKKEGDRYLSETVKELKRVLKKAQSSFLYNTLYLSERQVGELASVLVEFAEDIHNDIGIWKSYEQYNREFFHIPLPITLRSGAKLKEKEEKEELGESGESGEKELFKYRIHHLIWVLYSVLVPGLIFEPEHKDLTLVTGMAADFLEERFARIPLGSGSGIKEFLSQPNEYGWDVKRKLVWLGQHSYLFRNSFQNYALEEGYAEDVSTRGGNYATSTVSSFPRKRESRRPRKAWIPVFTGMTVE